MPFSGDPDTTEEGCREQEKDTFGQFLDCSWDFEPRDYGMFGNFQQGDWRIDHSTTSSDGHSECGPREDFQSGFCTNPVMRYEVTTTQDQTTRVGMSPDRDWVFSTDYSRTLDLESSKGGADIFQLHIFSELPNSRNYIDLVEFPTIPGIAQLKALNADNTTNRTVAQFGQEVLDLFLQPVKITVHYKADTRLFDFWVGDQILAADFFAGDGVSEGGIADLVWVQVGSSSPSAVITQSFDNLMIGPVASGQDVCGPTGPGANPPGDFNCDGVVDVADLGIVGANFSGAGVTYVDGDANLDGNVDVADLGIVGANWTAAQGASLSQALRDAGLNTLVPEPATVAVLVVGWGCLGRRRRRAIAVSLTKQRRELAAAAPGFVVLHRRSPRLSASPSAPGLLRRRSKRYVVSENALLGCGDPSRTGQLTVIPGPPSHP